MTDSPPRRPAVFFDRDGTLNEDRHFPHLLEDLAVIPGAPQAVQRCRAAGFHTVIVTNQSGIARGHFDTAAFERFNAALLAALAQSGATIDLTLHCPHHPDFTGACKCRKPAAGMIHNACTMLRIDLSASFLIGDRLVDMQCAEAAGIEGYRFTEGNLDDFVADILKRRALG